ncbi:MAG: hypothetical protein EHM78_08775 [Myxococcaceae bacterium]|nr:MAG: hypothetical protein EHM78_08775 [Myxococcaceae bacterium]
MGRLALAGVVLLVTSCASTKVESTWTNPSFPSRKIRSFAVFASTNYPSGRIEFEQALTDGLRKRGLEAIPGYQFVSYDEYPGKAEILRRVQAKGVQGALISKTVQRFTSEQVNPVVVGGAVSSGWDAAGFYEYWSAPLTFAEYTTEENKFIGETVLWALPDDKAMWAMRTSTRRTDPGAFADDIAATVAADLRKAGIVPE